MCKTADSLADYADSRRQKTGWTNGSAKADAADYAEKDRYHIVEILLFDVYLRNNAACCIHLRDLRYLRYLRENKHARGLKLSVRYARSFLALSLCVQTADSLADFADYADKRQLGQMDLLKQMPQISLTKTDTTL